MKRSYLYTLLFCALFTGSCIDEYDAELPSSDENRLVVEGNICSDMLCTFYLSRSVSLNYPVIGLGLPAVTDARLSVVGEDGTVFEGTNIEGGYGVYRPSGAYQIQVGTLRPDVRYWLRIETGEDVFTSDPQFPFGTDPIDTLFFEQKSSDQEVEILLTAAAPADNQRRYYRWDYKEFWEVTTPYKTEYEYDPGTNTISKTDLLKNHGWHTESSTETKMGCSTDFQENHIVGMPIISIPHTDNRFNTKYFARVFQRRISQDEYEYEALRAKLSGEMGGLFTPMPADLPTNIHCETGDHKAIGYVGISGQVASATIAISRSQVNYERKRVPSLVNHRDFEPAGCRQIYYSGYRLVSFNYEDPHYQGYGPYDADAVPDKKWAERWCVDCTDPFWNASLKKPDDWPE
ncbi:MAG: DUF4249 domain-containing protein [Bacteroidaceae bacterium]|nr:DUF4249 domain-containing protein [Bacteroidaceae bacterium]